tara:strand:+ start:176 stop:685 length:510 start_codon:yes stop_codon:yes gene_type:complete
MINENPVFDGPIPGEGMTHELGARPWQQPAQYTTVEEALDFYIPRFSDEEVVRQLLDVLQMGVPVTTLANTIQLGSVMEGKHSIDVGMLVMPVIMELIMYIAEEQGVKYTSGLEKDKKLRSTLVDSALVRLEEETNNQEEPAVESENEIETTEVEEVSKDVRKGLMGRS